MTTLEKLAERVREAPAKVPYSTCSTCEWDYNELRCSKCEFGSEVHNPQYAEEIARWAVKLVAGGLGNKVARARDAGPSYEASLGLALLNLIAEAEEVPDGR